MGWNQRSLGGRYKSPPDHAFPIGTKTKKSLLKIVISKKCYICGRRRNLEEEELDTYDLQHEEHDCTCNFDGSSKGMESEAFVQFSTKAFRQKTLS